MAMVWVAMVGNGKKKGQLSGKGNENVNLSIFEQGKRWVILYDHVKLQKATAKSVTLHVMNSVCSLLQPHRLEHL